MRIYIIGFFIGSMYKEEPTQFYPQFAKVQKPALLSVSFQVHQEQ